jgi:hypothetical protein
MKNFKDPFGNQSSDLSECISLPQPAAQDTGENPEVSAV